MVRNPSAFLTKCNLRLPALIQIATVAGGDQRQKQCLSLRAQSVQPWKSAETIEECAAAQWRLGRSICKFHLKRHLNPIADAGFGVDSIRILTLYSTIGQMR